MRTRRDLLAAGAFAGLAAAVSAGTYVVAARRRLVPLSRGHALERLPASVGAWIEEPARADMVDPIIVDAAFATALRIYDLEVQRNYVAASGQRIMLDGVFMQQVAQEDKFHWPEFCYATQGFKVKRFNPVTVPMPSGTIDVSRFLAIDDDRRELVLYVTRIGRSVPVGGAGVRLAIFRSSLGTTLPDAVLLRVSLRIDSASTDDVQRGTNLLRRFLSLLVTAAQAETRTMLVGEYA